MDELHTDSEKHPRPLPPIQEPPRSFSPAQTESPADVTLSGQPISSPFHPAAPPEVSVLATASAPSAKAQRTFELTASCSEIVTSGRCVASSLQATLEGVAPLSTLPAHGLNLDQAIALLRTEIETDTKVHTSLEAFSRIVSRLDQEVLRRAFREYQSSTGLLDDHPRLSAAVCAGLGITSLGLGVYGAIVAHGPLHHATEALVGAFFGHGLLGSVASVVAVPVSLFFLGIPVLGSSVVGPLAFGALKVLGGKITRAISPNARARFEDERQNADILRDKISASAQSILEDIARLQPLLNGFMDRNEVLRNLASSSVAGLTNEQGRNAAIDELRTLNKTLGAKEFASGIRLLNLERSLRQIQQNDFRSPELRIESNADDASSSSGFVGKLHRGFSLAFSAIRNFAASSQGVGTETALHTADDMHHTCDHMPNGALDPITATGSSLGTTLHIALETGTQPEKAVLDAVKGILGLVKSSVAGGVPKGPSGAALVRVLLELEEIERGNRVRWLVKLGPSIAFALLKKPALVLKAQKLEEASGKITPEMFESDHAKSKGRMYSAWKSAKEIASLTYDLAREGGYRWLVEFPLSHIRDGGTPFHHLANSQYTKQPMARLSTVCGNFLQSLDIRHQKRLESQMKECIGRIPAGEELANMDSEALTTYAARKYLDYRYSQDSAVSEEEINNTLAYWRLRDTSAWYREKRRIACFRKELGEIDPRLISLNDTLHGANDIRSMLSSSVGVARKIGSKLRDPSSRTDDTSPTSSRERLQKFVDDWNQGDLMAREVNTVLDCGPEGSPLLMLTRSGQLELLEGAAGRLRLINASPSQPLSIMRSADHVRIAASEMYLATPLEGYQREALLRAHSRLLSGTATQVEVTQDLVDNSFSLSQLEGVTEGPERITPGLLEIGIIGK